MTKLINQNRELHVGLKKVKVEMGLREKFSD